MTPVRSAEEVTAEPATEVAVTEGKENASKPDQHQLKTPTPGKVAPGRSAREGSEQEEELSPKAKMREGGRKGVAARARGKSERASGAGEEEVKEEEPVNAKGLRQRTSEGGRKGSKATQRKRGTAKEGEEEGEEGGEEEEPAETESPPQRTAQGDRRGGKVAQRKRGTAKEEEASEEESEEASEDESGGEKPPKQRASEGRRKGGKATKAKAEEGTTQEGSPDKSPPPRERKSQGEKKGGKAAAQRASGQGAGSPANKRAKQELGAEPFGGDGGHAESSRTLESGTVTFLYKPRVGLDEASSLQDVQRFYLLLEPQPSESKARLLIIGKKRMPKRMFGFVAAVGSSPAKLAEGLGPSDYATKTKGERHVEGARVVGVGAYSVVTRGDHTHFAYTLNAPGTPGAAQDAFEIEEEATYIILIKNPYVSSNQHIGLSEKAEFAEEKAKQFGNYAWIPLHDPTLLDTAKAELLFIGATTKLPSELGEVAKHAETAAEDEDKDAILQNLHAEID